ncbi:16995_t:CDS:2, partial [Cetraspora pellucida]
DLHRVYTKISLAVTNQRKVFDVMIVSECIRFLVFATNNSFNANIKGKVSSFALKKINEHSYQKDPLQMLLQDLQQKYQEWPEFQQLTTRDALKNIIDELVMTLQNPKIVHTKGCSSGALNK